MYKDRVRAHGMVTNSDGITYIVLGRKRGYCPLKTATSAVLFRLLPLPTPTPVRLAFCPRRKPPLSPVAAPVATDPSLYCNAVMVTNPRTVLNPVLIRRR